MTTTDTSSAYPLHLAVMRGDYLDMKRLIDAGADINALDDQGRTVVACAVIGEDWNNPKPYIPDYDADSVCGARLDRYDMLSALIEHPSLSLYTLNAPQRAMKGVTPLGFAAYINDIKFVKTLLETGESRVAVDGRDTHGATPLMYAARDGSIDIVNTLIAWGARPDCRDSNHRSALHYGLRHPRVLCLLEDALREHRWYENQLPTHSKIKNPDLLLPLAAASLDPCSSGLPNPRFFTGNVISRPTTSLIQAINAAQIGQVYNTLFPPNGRTARMVNHFQSILVNRPDSRGWSPIHYCVSHESPSIEVLDALYSAGADMCLFTAHEQYTPLHCLAKFANSPSSDNNTSVYQFTIHLIRDLQAPLSARDRNNETCMHIAAERGESLDVLLAILDCDTTSSVRQMRNDRGLTPLDVAKPQFRIAFTIGQARIASSLRPSNLSPRPKSLPSLPRRTSLPSVRFSDDQAFSAHFDFHSKTKELLAHLRFTSPSIEHGSSSGDLSQFELTLRLGARLGQEVIEYLQVCLDDVTFESRGACIARCNLNTLWETTQTAREASSRFPHKRAKPERSPGGSEATVVDADACLFDVDKLLSFLDDGDKSRKEAVIQHRDVYVSTRSSEHFDNLSPTLIDASDPSSPIESEDGVRKEGRFSKLIRKSSFIRRFTAGPEDEKIAIDCLLDISNESELSSLYPELTRDPEGCPEGPQKDGVLRTLMKKLKDTHIDWTEDKPTSDGDLFDGPAEPESRPEPVIGRKESIRGQPRLRRLKKKAKTREFNPTETQDDRIIDIRPDSTPDADPELSTEYQETIVSHEAEEGERKEGKLSRFIKKIESLIDEQTVGDPSDIWARLASAGLIQESADDHSAEEQEGSQKEGMLKSLMKRVKDSASTALKDKSVFNLSPDGLAKPEFLSGCHELTEESGLAGSTKLKVWLKRKISHTPRLKLLLDVEDDTECAVGHEVKQNILPPADMDECQDGRELSHNSTLLAVRRDLAATGRSIGKVDQSIAACGQALSRTERVIRTALQKREACLERMRMRSEMAEFDDLFVRPLGSLPAPPRTRTKSSPPEIASSRVSIRSFWSTASVANPGDDEDTRLLRRSLRRTEAQLCGVGDELDQVVTWLRILHEILSGVKREVDM